MGCYEIDTSRMSLPLSLPLYISQRPCLPYRGLPQVISRDTESHGKSQEITQEITGATLGELFRDEICMAIEGKNIYEKLNNTT